MSELKAFDIVVAEEGNGEGIVKYRRAVYDKAEVDKVISELKADYKDACDRLQTANLIKDEQLAAARHNKYKRCLDKAKLCKSEEKRLEAIAPLFDTDKECWEHCSDYYVKWHERWIALAEKFKEVI